MQTFYHWKPLLWEILNCEAGPRRWPELKERRELKFFAPVRHPLLTTESRNSRNKRKLPRKELIGRVELKWTESWDHLSRLVLITLRQFERGAGLVGGDCVVSVYSGGPGGERSCRGRGRGRRRGSATEALDPGWIGVRTAVVVISAPPTPDGAFGGIRLGRHERERESKRELGGIEWASSKRTLLTRYSSLEGRNEWKDNIFSGLVFIRGSILFQILIFFMIQLCRLFLFYFLKTNS